MASVRRRSAGPERGGRRHHRNDKCAEGAKCDEPEDTGVADPAEEPCDPSDLSHTPDTPEGFDGVDNNCNGEVDEGVTEPINTDVDGDGFGDDAAEPVDACEVPEGWVSNHTDCDDAEEFRDDVDNDCDGERDEDVGVQRWVDADGDGYGDPGTGTLTLRRSRRRYPRRCHPAGRGLRAFWRRRNGGVPA